MHFPRTLHVLLALCVLSACQCGTPATGGKHKEKGEPCTSDTECTTGLCEKVPGESAKKCIVKCSVGCDAKEICTPLDLNRFGCVPEREGLCRVCSNLAPCPYPADLCVSIGGVNACGRDCSFDGKCPTGYHCDPAFDKNGNQVGVQCQPSSGTCSCTPSTIGQQMPCQVSNPAGTCVGTQTCDDKGYSACNAPTPIHELCNGQDDDCNGQTDEGLGTTTCGVGECKRTVDNCVDGGLGACTPGAAGVEICNEKDDDCNGVVDDGFNKLTSTATCGSCTNACTTPNGVPKCTAGVCGIASCTMPFANCNGLIPDGCETDTSTSLAHCGACNAVCSATNATGSCAGGICTLQCKPGYVDLDGNPANGCEYACTVSSTTDVPDLGFVDANCDGIDGEVTNSIFVSAAGNDVNPGTRLQPKATIQAGLNAAVAQNKRDVLVSIGNYSNQVSMPSNRGLYGGYAPATWTRAIANIVNVNNVNAPLLIESVSNVTVQLMNFLGTTPSGSSATAYGAVIRSSTGVTLEGLQIRAGNGTAGANGSVGGSGGFGSNGFTGQAGCEDSGGFCSGCSQPQGGSGGGSSCGRSGGRGGNAGHSSGYGDPGGTGVGGTSGGAGVPPYWGNSAPGAGYTGYPGNDGAPGGDGASAGAIGTLTSFGYVVALASGGIPGSHGNGGGGGGGGGGGDSNCDSYGGGGGGGGAGGCSGGGGGQGLSGGASIAVFLDNSTVNAIAVQLRTGNGGLGGNGGAGGPGGLGGAGAVASNGSGNEYGGGSEQDDGSNGARGGKGGNGGPGGDGGAGAGGPVLGVVLGNGATWTPDANTVITLGTAGTGGSSSAGAGATGLSQAIYP